MNMAMANTEKTGMRGPLKRIDEDDATTAVEVLKAAIICINPKDRSNRQMFAALMPYLYVLRNMGCNWEQITKLLADCKINLQVSTVRTYYSEMLADRQDECQRRLNEQILMLREVRKVTESADATFDSVVGMATAIYDRHKRQALPTIEKLFGVGSAGNDEQHGGERRQAGSTAQRSTAQPEGREIAGRSPAAEKADPAQPAGNSEFGLLNTTESSLVAISKPWAEDEPAIPVLTGEPASPVVPKNAKTAPAAPQPGKKIAAASPPTEKTTAPTPASPGMTTTLRCLPLEEGVPPLGRRAEVPSTVYEIGLLEHPAIPGLMLSLEERLFGGYLSLVDTDGGETRQESIKEKPWRVQWKKPIAQSESRTGKDHVPMNMGLFKKRPE